MTSDFWLNKLRSSGGSTPAPQPQGGLTASGAPWWAHPTYTPPAPAPVTPAPPTPGEQSYSTVKAASARHTELCPNCQSDHYWRPTTNAAARCYDCGHNDRAMNSTQGMAVANSTSAPKRASLHQAQGSGYHPEIIIGRM